MSISTKQFYKNSIWTFIELTSFPLLVILSTPIFISKLGIEQYGLWMLVNTITQAINVLNFGLGDSNIALISKYRSSNQVQLIQKVFKFNFSLAILLCFLSFALGFLLYSSSFIAFFYQSLDYQVSNKLLLLSCFLVGTKFLEIVLLSVFKAFERFDLYSQLSSISKSSVILTSVFLCFFNCNLFQILIASLITSFINIIVQIFVLKKFKENILQWPSVLFFKERNLYFKYNFWYWLQSSIGLLGFLADKLAVAWFTNVKTLAYYYIASMVGTNIHNFFMAFGGFIFPRVSYKLESNTNVLPLYYFSRACIFILGSLIAYGLILFGNPIFELWLGTETFTNSIYYIDLYLVYIVGMLMIITPYYFINGTSQLKLNSFFELLLRSSNFVFMLVGHYFYGISGILYGLILSTFINVPMQYFFFHKKVLNLNNLSWLYIMLPVLFLLGFLVFENLIIKVCFSLTFLLSLKIIYFDRAKPYFEKMGIIKGFRSKF